MKIQPPAVGGPYTVKIAGHETAELHNVMVGDVWLCGGQSNIGLPLRFALNGADEVKAALSRYSLLHRGDPCRVSAHRSS